MILTALKILAVWGFVAIAMAAVIARMRQKDVAARQVEPTEPELPPIPEWAGKRCGCPDAVAVYGGQLVEVWL